MRVLNLVFFIIASIVGAGFASGKEIATYFSRYGFLAIPSAVATGIVLYVLIKQCLFIGKNKANFTLSKPFRVLLYLALCFLCGSAFSANAVLGKYLGIPHFVLINLAIAFVVLLAGIKGVKKLNFVISPVLIISIILLVLLGENQLGSSVCFQVLNTPIKSFVGIIGYVSFNFILVAMFLIDAGKDCTEKEIKLASAISCTIITALILIIAFVVMYSKTNIMASDMPLLTFAFNVSRVAGVAMVVVIWLGLFTTLASCLYSMSRLLGEVVKNRTINLIINLIIVYLVSRLGFDFIVKEVYFFTGIVGISFVINLLKFSNVKYGKSG